MIARQPNPSALDRDAVKSVSAEARGDAALMRATRTPRGSLREAVQLLAQAVGILWLTDRGKPEPPEVRPFTNPARCERRSHCRGSLGVYPRRLQSARLSARTLLTASRSRSVAPLSKTQTRRTSIPKSRSPLNQLVARGVVGGMEGCPVCCSFRSCGRPLVLDAGRRARI